MEDPFEKLQCGDADYFTEVSNEILLNYRDENGDSLLSRAVMQQDLKWVRVIYNRCQELLYTQNNEGYHALHHAAVGDDLGILRFIIDNDIEGQRGGKTLTRLVDNNGDTALMIAVRSKKTKDAVKLLVEGDPLFLQPANLVDETPMKLCMSDPNMQEIFKLLLEEAPIQSETRMAPKGWTVLHDAAASGNLTAVKDILQFCPDCSKVLDNKGQNFLHVAAQFQQVEVLRFCIVEKKVTALNVWYVQDNDGKTPWHWITSSNFQMIENVLRDYRDNEGELILFEAVRNNELELCRTIFSSCPSLVYCQEPVEGTVLHQAAWKGNAEMVDLLISAGAKAKSESNEKIESQPEIDPKRKLLMMINQEGDTALHIAVRRYNLEAAKLLIEADPDIAYNANNYDQTPLSMAMERNNTDMFKLLLEASRIQRKTPTGLRQWTTLHDAAATGNLSAVKDILEFCLECSEVVDIYGQNFLHVAAQFEHVEVVRFCVKKKDIPWSVLSGEDIDGYTPLSIAASTENEDITLCLLSDHRVDKKLPAKHLIWALRVPNLQIVKIICGANPGCLDRIEIDVLRDTRDRDDESILSVAVKENELGLCKMICKRCPSLVYCKSQDGKTALHHAARAGNAKVVELLINTAKADPQNQVQDDIENQAEGNPQRTLLTMADDQGDTALHIAVLNHNLEAAKFLIEGDPDILYGVNIYYETPLSIAIQEARSHQSNPNTGEIRKLLLGKQSIQCTAYIWENGQTSLHSAASHDDLRAVVDFINLCPPTILELVDNEGMSFLHAAVRSNSIHVVKHVLERVPYHVLNGKDNDGHSPFHLAALIGDESLTTCFLYNDRVDKYSTNNEGQIAKDAVKFDYDKLRAGVHGHKSKLSQRELKDRTDFDLVVSALIATVSFTAGITLPGGYITNGDDEGTATLSKKPAFEAFVISNTCALLFSICVVLSLYCTRRLEKAEDISFQLDLATYGIVGALYAMMAAFISGSFAVLANSTRLAVPVCVISCIFYIFSIYPLGKIVMQKRNRSSRRAVASRTRDNP